MGKRKSSSQLGRRRRELKDNDGDNGSRKKRRKPEEDGAAAEQHRSPLSKVVSDCVERWFQDTLKEAKAGDFNMQVLVGQMYYNGYGVLKDADKGKFWITKASKMRSSVWKVCNKRPDVMKPVIRVGYNASDSDSDVS